MNTRVPWPEQGSCPFEWLRCLTNYVNALAKLPLAQAMDEFDLWGMVQPEGSLVGVLREQLRRKIVEQEGR